MPSREANEVSQVGISLVRAKDLEEVELHDFSRAEQLIVLLHGFTSHGKYLQWLGIRLCNVPRSLVMLVSYDSYLGIQHAADNLCNLMNLYDTITEGKIREQRVFLVAHSMGGLVARAVALDQSWGSAVRGVALLGVPNNGAFVANRDMGYLVKYGQYLSGFMPDAQNPSCLSAKELVKADSNQPYIDELNARWATSNALPPTLSIAGGYKQLEFTRNFLVNKLINIGVQRAIGNRSNDGLIAEESVDLNNFPPPFPSGCTHLNTYPDFSRINHTNLIKNQTIALELIKWIIQIAGVPYIP